MANILIVDDSLVMRRSLGIILKEAGHTIVGEASNGQQAYLLYRRFLPDIVTMDITMPNVDGIEGLRKIMTEDPSAKVIMISALDQKSKVYKALRNGAKHYIVKPLTAEKISSVIDSVLEQKSDDTAEIKTEEISEQAFEIKTEEGVFFIEVKRNLSYEDVIVLLGAIQGFLYLDAVSIQFNFEKFDVIGEDGLSKFEAILNKIRSVEGHFQIKAKKPGFINRLSVKDTDLVKTFNAGEFVLE